MDSDVVRRPMPDWGARRTGAPAGRRATHHRDRSGGRESSTMCKLASPAGIALHVAAAAARAKPKARDVVGVTPTAPQSTGVGLIEACGRATGRETGAELLHNGRGDEKCTGAASRSCRETVGSDPEPCYASAILGHLGCWNGGGAGVFQHVLRNLLRLRASPSAPEEVAGRLQAQFARGRHSEASAAGDP